MKNSFYVTFILLVILLLASCGEISPKNVYSVPEKIITQAMTKDPSARLVEIEVNDKEERYIFVGKEGFGIIDKTKTDFYTGENPLLTISNLKAEDFANYKTIDDWNISYEEAQRIATKIDKPFPIEISNQGVLRHSSISKQCGAMIDPSTNSLIISKNPYWRLTGFEEMRLFNVYIDSVHGEVIHTCYGPRK